jgi:hypothetical protein
MATGVLDLDLAERHIDVIVYDEQMIEIDPEVPDQRGDRQTGFVHEGPRDRDVGALAFEIGLCDVSRNGLPGPFEDKRAIRHESLDNDCADVVAGVFV